MSKQNLKIYGPSSNYNATGSDSDEYTNEFSHQNMMASVLIQDAFASVFSGLIRSILLRESDVVDPDSELRPTGEKHHRHMSIALTSTEPSHSKYV